MAARKVEFKTKRIHAWYQLANDKTCWYRNSRYFQIICADINHPCKVGYHNTHLQFNVLHVRVFKIRVYCTSTCYSSMIGENTRTSHKTIGNTPKC